MVCHKTLVDSTNSDTYKLLYGPLRDNQHPSVSFVLVFGYSFQHLHETENLYIDSYFYLTKMCVLWRGKCYIIWHAGMVIYLFYFFVSIMHIYANQKHNI